MNGLADADTGKTFIGLVGFDMVVKSLLSSANFVTNVTLHFILTMTNLVKPQLLSSEK